MSEPPSSMVPSWIDPHRIGEVMMEADHLLRVVLGTIDDAGAAPASIHAALVERRDRCRPDLGDWRPLSPQPEVNDLLGRMVAILRGASFSTAERTIGTAVDRVMVNRVDGCTALMGRANELRQISAEAEAEMERHFSDRWFQLLTTQASSQAGLGSLVEVMRDFPYYDGYRELVAAEATLLSTPRRFIFGGSGPLPMSGLLLASIMDAQVVLIDSDAQATARSSRLIQALEERGLVCRDRIEVRQENIAEIALDEPCGGIVVASLVDTKAKVRLAQRLSERADPSPPLILRSAIGMCAKLAYHAAPREAVVAAGLEYRGELVPSNHVVAGLDPLTARHFEVRSDRAQDLIATLPSSVLNSVELFGPVTAGDER